MTEKEQLKKLAKKIKKAQGKKKPVHVYCKYCLKQTPHLKGICTYCKNF